MAKKSLSLDEQKKMVEEASEDVVAEEVKESPDLPGNPKAETKLEAALRTLQVASIPCGVGAINTLNQQVQELELRVKALEGKL